MTVPLPASGSTSWYSWAQQVDAQGRGAIPAIVLTPTGVASTDGPAMDAAVTQAFSEDRPIHLKTGLFRRTTAWDCRGDGLVITADGVMNTAIEQQTSNTPVMRIGGQFQQIGGFTTLHSTQQAAANTSGNSIEMYKAYHGMYGPWRCLYAARGLFIPQVDYLGTGNYIFSCYLHDIRITGFTIAAIDLQAYNSANTGCLLDNLYTINDLGDGTGQNAVRAVILANWDEINIRQLNVEDVTVTGDASILFNGVKTGKLSGLHYERVKHTQWGSGFINVYFQSRMTIDGFSIVNCPFANAAGGQADVLGIVKIGDQAQLQLVGFNNHDCTPVNAGTRALVIGDGISSSLTNAQITASDHTALTNTDQLINTHVGGTATQFPVLKRLNDDWRHFTMGGKNVSYGTAAPTTGTWAVGDKVWNTAPAAAGAPGWVCTTAGTPGTWKAMAVLAA